MGAGRTFLSRQDVQHGVTAPAWKLRCNDTEKARQLLATHQVTIQGDVLQFFCDNESMAAVALRRLVENSIEVYEFTRIHEGLSELVLNRLRKNE